MQTIASIMNTSNINKALLFVGDTAGKSVYPKDRSSAMLFGEAGAVMLLEKTDNEQDEINALIRSDGTGYRYMIVPGGGYRNLHASEDVVMCRDGNPRTLMNSFIQGTSVFTFTIFDVPRLIKDFWAQTDTTPDDYDCYAFHQANLYILKQIAKKTKIDFERMPITLDRYGNTSGASAIVSLCDRYGNSDEHKVVKVMACGFGIGISLGTTSFDINTDDILPIFEDEEIFEEGLITDPNQLYNEKK
jgi:3-oxoacyl-[acyl-carrier-protein] synthase-3